MKNPTLLAFLFLALCALNLKTKAADVSDLDYINNGLYVTILSCDSNASGELIIPEKIEGKQVAIIGDDAFANSKLTSVTLPAKLVKLGARSFISSFQLTSIVLNNNLETIAIGAFSGCTSLKKIEIPDSVTFLGESVFSGCSSMENLLIGNGITEIRQNCFANSGIRNLSLGKNVTSIGSRAFYGNSLLENVSFNKGLQSIGDLAFSSCSNLKEVNLPDSLTGIGYSCFKECKNLTNVNVGNTSGINQYTFENCSKLSVVTLGERVSYFGRRAFGGCVRLGQIIYNREVAPKSFAVDDTAFEGVNGAAVLIRPDAITIDKNPNNWGAWGNTWMGFPVFINAPVADSDNDGVIDEDDAFPNDPNETVDSDGDGVGDNADAFPNYKGEIADSDGDGIGDNAQSAFDLTAQINSLQFTINQLDTQIKNLDNQIAVKNNQIESLEATVRQNLSLDDIQDLRIGSVILTTDVEKNRATLKIKIEESSDLKTWTLKNTITKYYPIPEGKGFYRFALDK